QVLDNPLQDLPVLAVLHSPLAGLTVNELATIRLAGKGPFWTALVRWGDSLKSKVQSLKSKEGGRAEGDSVATADMPTSTLDTRHSPLAGKVSTFLDRFARWRRLARQTSLSRCLETVLAETHYDTWLLAQPRGEQRHANVQRLLRLAQ